MPVVFEMVGAGFGDMWASLHWCLQQNENPVHISTLVGTGPYTNERVRLEEMLCVVDTDKQVVFTDERGNTPIGYNCWTVRYLPTKEKWSKQRAIKNLICYQFDGRSGATVKNPPPSDVDDFLLWARSGGINVLRVGTPYSIQECIRMLCICDAFVGSCSGMSTLALSVGVPVFVTAYHFSVSFWYGPNPHVVCANIKGFTQEYEPPLCSGEHDPWGIWQLDTGCTVTISRGGSALWQDHTHSVQGFWRKNPLIIHWHNGFKYTFCITKPNRATVTQTAPDGSFFSCLAYLKSKAAE